MRRTLQRIMLVAVIPAVLVLFSDNAWAQRGRGGGQPQGGGQPANAGARPPANGGARPPAGHGGAQVHGSVYVGGYYGYGYWGYPYWGIGWGYPYWYGPWGYPYWGYPYYDDPTPEIRLEVKPKQAQVYVDGYYAGIVDDFDGTFQRLRLRPGNHELVLYLEGYRTVKQNIHVGSRQDSKIKFQMQPLAAGEQTEPPPQPTSPPPDERPEGDVQAYPPRQAPDRRPAPPEPGGADQSASFGSLVIRVLPAGAEVLVDGERWQGPEGSERLVIQVSEGSHRIEVRKEGYVPFSTTVQVRRGETSPLNVSLPPRSE